MKLTFRKCEVKDLSELESLVAEHAETVEPGLRIIASNLNLGRSSVALAGLDAARRPVLIAVGLTADDAMIFRMVEAYAWCLEYPESVQRLLPAGDDPSDWPPRVAFVAERLLESFLRKIRLLKFPRVDCFEYRYVEVNGTTGFYLDPVDWTRDVAVPPTPPTADQARRPIPGSPVPPPPGGPHQPLAVDSGALLAPPRAPGWDDLLGARANTVRHTEETRCAAAAETEEAGVARSAVALGADDARPAPSGLDLDSTPTWRKFLDKLTGGFETRLMPPLEENHRAEPAATTSTAAASVVAEDPSSPPIAPELDTNVRAQVPVSAPRSGLDPLVSDDAYDKQRLLLEGLKLPPNGELAPQWRKFLDKPATLDEGKAGIVREYLRREFPMSMLYEFHEFQRNAQVFELQDNHGKVIQLATITAEFLDHHTESELRAWIETHRLAQALRQAGQAGGLVTRAGLQVDHR